MGFPRQEYWSELPLSSLGNLPDPGIQLPSLELQVDSLLLNHWEAHHREYTDSVFKAKMQFMTFILTYVLYKHENIN